MNPVQTSALVSISCVILALSINCSKNAFLLCDIKIIFSFQGCCIYLYKSHSSTYYILGAQKLVAALIILDKNNTLPPS